MNTSDFRFLHCGTDPHCTARVDKSFDGYYTLQLMEQKGGAVEVWYDDQSHTLDSREGVWFWPAFPGPRIRFHAAPGSAFWRHRYAAFQGSRIDNWIADGLWPTLPQRMPAAHYCRRFDDLVRLLKSAAPDPWRSARGANLLEAFLLELAEARAADTPEAALFAPWLVEVMEALAAAPTPSCSTLASKLDMAPSTLRRRFREAAGVPLHEYVLRQRIAEARTLLGDTDLPIKAIAERLGYQDVFFFTRQFRFRTGVTPAVYRRSRQG